MFSLTCLASESQLATRRGNNCCAIGSDLRTRTRLAPSRINTDLHLSIYGQQGQACGKVTAPQRNFTCPGVILRQMKDDGVKPPRDKRRRTAAAVQYRCCLDDNLRSVVAQQPSHVSSRPSQKKKEELGTSRNNKLRDGRNPRSTGLPAPELTRCELQRERPRERCGLNLSIPT